MRWIKSSIRTAIVGSMMWMPVFGGPSTALAAAQEPTQTGPLPAEVVDMTPAEQSPEVQKLLKGRTFAPDPGEPAGAIKTYLATDEKVRTAMRRIRLGLLPGEADFDPGQLLNEALVGRQQAVALYAKSRHAWQGLGDVFWYQYMWGRRSADLRKAVDMYTEASKILMRQGAAGIGKDLADIVRSIAGALAALSDVPKLDAFFGSLRGTEFWLLAQHEYPSRSRH